MDQKPGITDPEQAQANFSPGAAPELSASRAHIPDHELLRCIGRGSYGEVWLARNQMGVFRAVKIVYRDSFTERGPFERELSGIRRFEPISRSHEGFVDVLHVGINEGAGYFYYIMELGDDQYTGASIHPDTYAPKTLARQLALHGRLGAQTCVSLGLVLTQALSELHKNELVHRDIKPSNIIFVNGVPKLADIGLVAQIDEARTFVGTAGFIPPEGPGTAAADIYALGKVLYEASTGNDRKHFPALPADCENFPDHAEFFELNEIVMQACQNEPLQRYASAEDMHAELVALTNGKSIRRLRVLEHRMRRLQRVAVVLALSVLVLSGLLYPVYEHWRAGIESRQRQIGADVAYGNRSMDSGDFLAALPYFSDALGLDQGNPRHEMLNRLRLGSLLAQCPKLTSVWSLGTRVNTVQLSPEGNRVLVCRFFEQVEIYELASGKLYLHPFAREQGVCGAAFSPDGRWVVTASEAKDACIWDAVTLENRVRLPHPDRVFSARFSPDNQQVVTACADGIARIWNAVTGELEAELSKHKGGVRFASYSQNGHLIATASEDHTVQIWDALQRRSIGPPLPHPNWVTWVAFSPDDQKLVTACVDHKARVWEMPSGRRILPDLEHEDAVRSVEFTPDGQLIFTASFDGTVRLWRSATLLPNRAGAVLRLGEPVTDACCSRDGRLVLTSCTDGSVRVWDLAGSTVSPLSLKGSFCPEGNRFATVTNELISVWNASAATPLSTCVAKHAVKTVVLNRNGSAILATSISDSDPAGTGTVLSVFDAETGKPKGSEILLTARPAGAILSDSGDRVGVYHDHFAQIYNVATGEALFPPFDHHQLVTGLALSRDGKRLAIIGGSRIDICAAGTGRPVCAPLEHNRPVRYAQFSPDGSLLVAACADSSVNKCFAQVWNAATGQAQGKPLFHRDGVLRAEFSADSRRVVTASEDFSAIEWDALTGKQLAPALRHKDQVGAAKFNPDDTCIVTASADHSARVWSAASGDPLTPPLLHLQKIADATFLPDGKKIITWDRQGDAWLWELSPDQRPVEDIMLLSYLLSGGTATPASGWSPAHPSSFQSIWQLLRTKYPADFSTSPEEVTTWHEFEAQTSELEGDWAGVVFHLQYLLESRPKDPSLEDRLRRAKAHLPGSP